MAQFKLKVGVAAEMKGPSGRTYLFSSQYITPVGAEIDAEYFSKLDTLTIIVAVDKTLPPIKESVEEKKPKEGKPKDSKPAKGSKKKKG